ncbi:cysteine desulfurase family protein [Staphylococcus canis]|uniref:Aminotransferase class V-fold PLP-dependent enzyme n=1 Tax=Staphylococcus canis TaxID=2724942 RepID=A0ABS0TB47_9STAP|nr:aminotransferase class V-fold PLP-dependent enzyme [Staphylococcus canis]MBI5974989.1 aminotransferase class V-fold PLP-dependent enzyme [Staphylococcus canis]
MIYLDNAATTQPSKRALDVYTQAQQALFFNSESLHIGGEQVRDALRNAREYIQQYFQTQQTCLFGTSGSHANQIAIDLYLKDVTSGEVWVSPYEHPSIAAALDAYDTHITVRTIPMLENGELDLDAFQTALTIDTVLIIAQHVNSETGYILPIPALTQIAEARHIPLHVDGVQAVHKVKPLDLNGVTSYSFSGHKFHGTKGTGILLIDYAYIHPLREHYFHEEGVRNGTIDVPSILATVQALSEDVDDTHLTQLHQHASQRAQTLGYRALSYDTQAPHILGLLTSKFEGQYVMQSLSNRNICISTGTACGHGILLSEGVTQKINALQGEVHQYIRLSFSALTTLEDIDACFDALRRMDG